MPYAVQSDIQMVFPSLTSAVQANLADAIIAAQRWADGRINGRLANRFAVPFSPVPDLIKADSSLLCAAFLWRSVFSRDDPRIKTPADTWEKMAMDDLDLLLSGEMTLSDATGTERLELAREGSSDHAVITARQPETWPTAIGTSQRIQAGGT